MKYTANFITENTLCNGIDTHNRQVEIVVDSTPVGHTKGWAICTFMPDRVVVSSIHTIDDRITYNRMLNVVLSYCFDKYGLEMLMDNDEDCEILTDDLEWIDGELQFTADSENVVRY